MTPFIIAIIATYNRTAELRRLLDSLAAHAPEVKGIVVTDNGSSTEIQEMLKGWRGQATYLNPGSNLGCGGGLKTAGETAWRMYGAELTHLAILDDDAVITPGAIQRILTEMERGGASLGCAMIVNDDNEVSWIPGLHGRRNGQIERQRLTPEQFIARFGSSPISFSWTQGICLIATRSAIAAAGFHEDCFWIRGEDLEYSLRLTATNRGIWIPGAIVQHLPPRAPQKVIPAGEYLKHCAMLQNVTYVAVRLTHGRRILWTLPSNIFRFLRTWGPRSAVDALRALWRGAVAGEPAGKGTGATFFKRSHAGSGG